jgi:hypothetical protein
MGKLLDICDLPRLNQEYIHNLNRSIMNKEIEAVIASQKRRAQDWMDAL